MRQDVKKFLFIGHHQALQSFFQTAQEAALVHFIDTSHLKAKELPADIQNVISAIKIIRELPTLPQKEPESEDETDEIVKQITDLNHNIHKLQEEFRNNSLELARIHVFGQFSLEDIAFIEKEGNRKIQYFFAKKGIKEEKKIPEELIYIGSEYDLDYFVAINKTFKQYDDFIEMRIEQDFGTLKKKSRQIETEIHHNEQELKKYAKYNLFLHKALTQKYNHYNLDIARSFARAKVDGQIFAVEGWVPKHRLSELKKLVADEIVQIFEIAIEQDETPPTLLENKGANRIGEDLVHIYDTPSYKDKDPSLWVLLSFTLFFAMIINDGGYAFLYLLAAFYFRYKFRNLRSTGLRVWKLVVILCSFCLIWGILTNSYFGMTISPDSGVRKVSILNWLVEKKAHYYMTKKDEVYEEWATKYPEIENAQTPQQFLKAAKKETQSGADFEMYSKLSDSILMELALLVGVIHISLSLLRYLDRNWPAFGWILAIVGCYLYFPKFLNATSLLHYAFGFDREKLAIEGQKLIFIGIGCAVVLSVIQNKWKGLLEVMNATQIFADILSYLRIYALGLAGSVISVTVNDIASSLGPLLAGMLLLIGHGINMVLAVVGGIIHGLRLNFIEWYHYSFEGGGKLFDPLRKVEVE